MIFIGKNKFPCKSILCCINNKSSKKSLDLKMSLICGAEVGKCLMTFFLINIPLPLFSGLTAKFFYSETDLVGWQNTMTFQIILIPILNYFFLVTSLSDPGIIPGRNWTVEKQEIARKYKNVNRENKIFYNCLNA